MPVFVALPEMVLEALVEGVPLLVEVREGVAEREQVVVGVLDPVGVGVLLAEDDGVPVSV